MVVRELIAAYQYDQARSRFLGSTWKRGRLVLSTVGAVMFFVMQAVMFYVTLSARKSHP